MDFLNIAKSAVSSATNFVMNYTEIETKVREATNNDPWGASGTLMTEIAQATYTPEDFTQVMDTIYKRLNESGKQWRHIYKALTLLEYLIKNGSEKCVTYARDHIYELKGLSHYELIDDKGKDVGLNVRNRSHEIVVLLGDTDRIKEARRVAKQSRDKFIGVSADDGRIGKFDSFDGSRTSSRSNYDDEFDERPSRSTTTSSRRYDEFDDSDDFKPSKNATANRSTSMSSTSSTSSKPSTSSNATSNFPSLGQPPSKNKPASTGDDGFADFQGTAAPAPKFQVVMSSAPAPASTASTSGGFDDFTSFAAPPAPASSAAKQGSGGFDAFASFSTPAPAATGFGNGFDAFASAPAPTSAGGFNAFGAAPAAAGGFGAFGGMSAPKTPSRPGNNVALDPFGDIPQNEISAVPSGPVLLPDSANGKAKVEAAVDDKLKSWAGAGLVDLDNLKKPAGSQQKKEEHKPMKPGMPLNSASTMPPMAAMGAMGGPPPMAGGMGYGAAPGFGQPMGGMPPMGFGMQQGGFGVPPMGAPMAGAPGMQPQMKGGFAQPSTMNGGFGRPAASSNPNGWSF